nr:FtsX-like permease family protein [Peptostreptococcus porci]
MSVYYAVGATYKMIRRIYILEGIIFALINSLIAIIISDLITRVIIEVIAQKNYNVSVLANMFFVVASIAINVIIYWKLIGAFNNREMSSLLRR